MRRSSRKSTMGVSIHQSLDSDNFTRVSTRRSSIFIPPPEDTKTLAGNFSTKFSLSSFINRVEKLTPKQRTTIENVGFGKLLRVPLHTLRKNLLVEWMERWDSERRAFVLLERELTITPLDVALILGIRGTGKSVTSKLEEPFSDIEEEYGADRDNRKISLSSLERRLQSLGESSDDDFVRTFLLFTFGALLFPNSNGKVDSRYLSILKDISKVSNYAWGVAVIEDLFNCLSRKKEEEIKNMEGCLILLQIWSYEHIDIGRPNLLSEPSDFPRACRWATSKSNAPRHLFTTKFNDLEEDQVVWKLQPVAAEMNIQAIKELLVAETEGNEAVIMKHLNATTTKATKTSTHCMGLPPKAVMDDKKKGNERGSKHDVKVCHSESSSLSTDVSTVTVDYLECSSSYDMQKVVGDQVVGTTHNVKVIKEENHALKTENSKLKKEIIELRRVIVASRENVALRDQSMISKLEDRIARLEIENADLKEENDSLRLAADFIEELERITPDEVGGLSDIPEDNSWTFFN